MGTQSTPHLQKGLLNPLHFTLLHSEHCCISALQQEAFFLHRKVRGSLVLLPVRRHTNTRKFRCVLDDERRALAASSDSTQAPQWPLQTAESVGIGVIPFFKPKGHSTYRLRTFRSITKECIMLRAWERLNGYDHIQYLPQIMGTNSQTSTFVIQIGLAEHGPMPRERN